MKYTNKVLEKLLFETCGEDNELVENALVEEVGPSKYHITYKKENPYEGLDFVAQITEIPYDDKLIHHINITESVYGDNGDFILEDYCIVDR